MDRDILDVPKGENCPQRIVTCEYCEFPLPAIDLLEHQEVCWNRTELCHMCHKYVRFRECYGHESRCSSVVNDVAESSRIEGTSVKVIVENEEQVELSFTRTWDPSPEGKQSPLRIDRRFVMLHGSPGFYSYAIFEHLEDFPGFNLSTTRIACMLNKDLLHYMAISDNRQRYMPRPEDRLPPRGQELEYPEAVLLVDPVDLEFKGEVDDKYHYSIENKDNKVHGWISSDPPVGFWQIAPSNEYRNGGPLKQDLTSHVNPTTLAERIFYSNFNLAKYGRKCSDQFLSISILFRTGKLFGPVFIHLNIFYSLE
ncbi:uncharacterized protein LOC127241482 isoform X2 [Andrographis paniculata]|uniref:uncharacterized protein LOC127241482 isoform X2 n=1 Tax=Andrographis paniculata TaxID=175694 RepID=UPI0021E727FB|nr:uncharacterized protein LOC127241482 isoform X2 [Andrographis paniculata]XP_051116517.1 uncharacterized protein LOC127241482 isoform X2 [Andrographis paniculata]